ncbi:ABC transporter substrate-binding protein ['Camptotheca acuminata' phytoplasma]|uniref:ABC transporter substrate-binding protein n=1 Tax='Camptotheca acuminata' phytoplasma TaxID=3239192 RepID=UPI00351A09F4
MPNYETVNSDLSLFPLDLAQDKKIVSFNSKKGTKVKALVVPKDTPTNKIKEKIDSLEKTTSNDFNFCGWFRFGFGGENILEPNEFGTPEERDLRTKDKKFSNEINEDIILHAYLEPKNSKNINHSDNETMKEFQKANVEHINPFDANDTAQSGFLSRLTSLFINTEIDWEQAIQKGHAKFVNDFSKFSQEPNEVGKRTPNTPGELSTSVLKPKFTLGILKQLPQHQELNGLFGNAYYEKSKNISVNKIELTFKDGLQFENGEPINAATLQYTIKQQLDPQVKHMRAENIFSANYLGLKNAQKYYSQKPENTIDFQEVGIKNQPEDPLTFTLEFESAKSLHDVINNLNSVKLVPPVAYDKAFVNNEKTQNSYGTQKHPFQSYGHFVIKEWSPNQKFVFNKNYQHFNKQKNPFKAVSVRIINEKATYQSMFKDQKLNSLPLEDDEIFQQYKNNPLIQVVPVDSRNVLALNNNNQKQKRDEPNLFHPLINDLDFRKALFYSINRNDISNMVNSLEEGNLTYLPEITSMFGEPVVPSYNTVDTHIQNIKNLSPETKGFNPKLAYELFKTAYNRLPDSLKQAPININFPIYKMQLRKVSLAKFLKDQFENCFNQEGIKIKININEVENWNLYVKEYIMIHKYDIFFHPVGSSDTTGYLLMNLESDEPQWSFGVGFGMDKKEIELDFSQLKTDLDSQNTKQEWYQKFINGFDADIDSENTDNKNDNTKNITNKINIPGVENSGKWKGTIKQFKHFFEATLKNASRYSEHKDQTLTHIYATLEKVTLDNLPVIPISISKGATVYKNMKFQWPNFSPFWGTGPDYYSNLTTDPDYV